MAPSTVCLCSYFVRKRRPVKSTDEKRFRPGAGCLDEPLVLTLIFLGVLRPHDGAPVPPKYHINLFWSEADGAWLADVPDPQSCSAFGDTPADALAEVE